MIVEEENYKDYPFSNIYVTQGESDFTVSKEEGVTRYQVDRLGNPDYKNPQNISVTHTVLFQGNILDCEAYIRLYDKRLIKFEQFD